ncbi:MBL fold metallo-hydrolase [Flavobacterium sp. '19STA2R22 D10 B1']|uniref:MBL fold metallo-hydrolase n=1 Tax=Flavobacterium aerium TaxID=3037261 RepID=UPI00278BCE8B|nr:MBL fold metallo-hydrolase [Flavobacterium sp. '19STA2R22 D10 B1']
MKLYPQFGKKPSGERLEKIKASVNYKDGAFQNLEFTPTLTEGYTYGALLKAYISPTAKHPVPKDVLPFVKTDLKTDIESNSIVWFGHSSYLLQLDTLTILVDPVFSGNASPFSFLVKNYPGSNEYSVVDLPEIDVLIITHDHYDHLDYKTVTALQSKVKLVITSLGVGSHLEYWGYPSEKIIELDWHDSYTINATTQITATPARHFSGRGIKRNQTLWSSFIVKNEDYNLFLGGDSGFGTHFKAIGNQYGPFDLAILECGQYNVSWRNIHTLPDEIIQVAEDLQTTKILPVHWSKFKLALHDWNEPVTDLLKDNESKKITILTPMIGEQFSLEQTDSFPHWWDTVK